MNWGDLLCGVPVTPESWGKGVVGFINGNSWVILDALGGEGPVGAGRVFCYGGEWDYQWNFRPIFPPRGWAGKTNAELWREVFGPGNGCILGVAPSNIEIHSDGRIRRCWHGNYNFEIPDPAALILALQNAQVLQRRLQAHNSTLEATE